MEKLQNHRDDVTAERLAKETKEGSQGTKPPSRQIEKTTLEHVVVGTQSRA